MNVVVNLGTFAPTTKPIAFQFKAPSRADVREPVILSCDADKRGCDPLLTAWDFGDGSYACGERTMKHAWMQSNRDYVVRASVTDMKGASASKMQVVAVGHPHAERLVGTIACDGKPVQDVRVNIEPAEPGSNTTTTDSDGNFALVGLEKRQYLLRMYKAGMRCSAERSHSPRAGR